MKTQKLERKLMLYGFGFISEISGIKIPKNLEKFKKDLIATHNIK